MPKKIIDQYTNRTDLTSKQTYALRHPGRLRDSQRAWRRDPKNKVEHAAYMRAWRMTNADCEEAIQKRHKKKVLLAKIQKMKETCLNYVSSESKTGSRIRKEVLRHHAKGRNPEDIVLWVNQPLSVVKLIIENHEKALAVQ